MQQMTRKFKKGEVYSPSDLGGVAMKKSSRAAMNGNSAVGDVVDALGMRPLDMYKVSLLRFSISQWIHVLMMVRISRLSSISLREVVVCDTRELQACRM